ncbi:MAG: D-alanyl-D-alanine carboxypeptidase/D-alanyl-D-alanine-endopeptidase [Proteobacteria bacterium]|nr:D-alanyl-D-alanine carboxypeptidase/D-alanyl-D-alanine-endopeptidase [Pseudomonadota bacterium]
MDACATTLPPPVHRALQAAGIPENSVAVVVEPVEGATPHVTGTALSLNADRAFNPASVMKLLTTFAALDLLGPAHTWQTEADVVAPLQGDVLTGDLFIKGGGDPYFTLEQFWRLLRQVRARGVRVIRGDLVLDRSLFDLSGYDSSPLDDKPLRPYNVGPDALLLNFKAVQLTLIPAATDVTVLPEPRLGNLEVINQLRLSHAACLDWKETLVPELKPAGGGWRLILRGDYPVACGEKVWNLGLMPHAEYVAGVFGPLWAELGGEWQGQVRNGTIPPDARRMGLIESPSLAEVVRSINKFSNNVMARELYLSLAFPNYPLRAPDAAAALRNWLAAKNMPMPELVLDNGSGLSRKGRISARSLAHLLQFAHRSVLMPEFVSSLPLVAVDGTLKKRLNGDAVAGQGHLKTGTLDGVKTIAGYLRDQVGREWVVVFLVNHANAEKSGAAQDALLNWLYGGGPDSASGRN